MMPLQNILSIAIPAITFFLMTIVGMDLTSTDFNKIRRSPRAFFVGSSFQYFLPLVTLLTFKMIHPPPEVMAGMILLASAPGGGISNFYTYLARANIALSVVLTAFSCLIASITMPALLTLFAALLPGLNNFQVPVKVLLAQLFFLLVVPTSAGIYLRYRYPLFVARYDRIFRRAGMIGLGMLIAFVLYQTRDLLLMQWPKIAITAALFIILSMTLGCGSAFLFRLSRQDSFTVAVELSVRNVAIATTAAVVILHRTEFAMFAAIYFLVEALIIVPVIYVYREYFSVKIPETSY